MLEKKKKREPTLFFIKLNQHNNFIILHWNKSNNLQKSIILKFTSIFHGSYFKVFISFFLKEAEKTRAAHDSSSDEDDEPEEPTHEPDPKPNPKLEATKKLPPSLEDVPSEFVARPLEDLDEYYHNQKVCIVLWIRNQTLLYLVCPSDEILIRGSLALLLQRHYEFPLGITIVQF